MPGDNKLTHTQRLVAASDKVIAELQARLRSVEQERDLARERLGPAGWKLLEELRELRSAQAKLSEAERERDAALTEASWFAQLLNDSRDYAGHLDNCEGGTGSVKCPCGFAVHQGAVRKALHSPSGGKEVP